MNCARIICKVRTCVCVNFAGESEQLRGGGEHGGGELHMVPGEEPVDADTKLLLPDGLLGRAAVEPEEGFSEGQVPIGAYCEDSQGRRRQEL